MLSINGTSVDLSIDRSWSVGTVTSVNATVPTGFSVGSPVTSSGNISIGYAAGYSLPTTASQVNWDAAYNDKINSASVTGTTTKTLTLNQQDGGVITASWTDFDTAPVSSVFGRAGTVVATSGDYTTAQVTESGNLYYTDARARASISLTTSGSSGASTYTSGVINIPNYTLSGLGGVPTSRTITINGTGLDMSADRTWSVGTITGSGSAGYIPKLTSGTNIANSLIYDNGTSVLINTNTQIPTPTGGTYTHAFQILGNAAGGMIISTDNDSAAIGIVNSASSNKTWDITPFGNDLSFNESGLASVMKFKAGGTIEMDSLVGTGTRMVVANSVGALSTQAIPSGGGITGSGSAGQVAYWTGVSSQSGNNNLFWDNATSRLGVGDPSPADAISVLGNTSGLYVRVRNQSASTGANSGINLLNNTSKTGGLYLSSSNYTTNGVLGANTLSLFSGPDTNISVAVNSSGYFSIGTGNTTPDEKFRLFNNGNLLLQDGGTFSDDLSNRLQVVGNIKAAGIIRSDAARTAVSNDVSISLLGSNITTYPANFSMSALGYGLNAIYAQHEQRFGGNATFNDANINGGGLILNKLQPTAAGTITIEQNPLTGTPVNIRTMSNLHLMTQFNSNSNLTVTHMSGLHIFGHYKTGGTGTLTVGTYYGVFLADPNEYGTGAAITAANWGFYQQGAAPTNHFGGRVVIGTTTVATSAKLQVDSTNQGFLPPRMTTVQMNAIATPAPGLIVYNTSDNKHYGYNGTTWTAFY
jgi:hypothetical protein